MRWVVLVGLVGCSAEGRSPSVDAAVEDSNSSVDTLEPSCEFEGRTYPGFVTWRDACNTCQCRDGIAMCTLIFCGAPNGDESDSCVASGACPDGPTCGDVCCNAGEHCNGYVCVCGEDERVCDAVQSCAVAPNTCGTCLFIGL
jgi:hypothetical protein